MSNLPSTTETVNQLQLFEQHLPAKPYCCDTFARGLTIMPRRAAIRRRYVEPQPPWSHLWLLFDVDRDASWYAADEAGLPAPSLTAVNRQNGHGHLLYGLQVPLRMDTFGGRKAPVRYAETIERAMTAQAYALTWPTSGFTVKNPLHRHWTVLQSGRLFTLRELHRLDRRPTAVPASTAGATYRAGPERRSVRRGEAVGISGRAGAPARRWEPGHVAPSLHRRRGARHGGAPAAVGTLGVPVDRPERWPVDVGAIHGRGLCGRASGTRQGQRQGTP